MLSSSVEGKSLKGRKAEGLRDRWQRGPLTPTIFSQFEYALEERGRVAPFSTEVTHSGKTLSSGQSRLVGHTIPRRLSSWHLRATVLKEFQMN